MQVFVSVASLESHRAEDNVSHPLLFVWLSHSIPTVYTLTYLSPVPIRSISPPSPFRLGIFWLFISHDYTVPSFSSPRLPSWWEFHPHRGNQIKKQACCLARSHFCRDYLEGSAVPQNLNWNLSAAHDFTWKRRKKKTKFRAVERSFPSETQISKGKERRFFFKA